MICDYLGMSGVFAFLAEIQFEGKYNSSYKAEFLIFLLFLKL